MKVRYQEDPAAWRKFTLGFALSPLVIAGLLWWRGVIGPRGFGWTAVAAVALVGMLFAVPRWNRAFYRVGLRIGTAIGGVVGPVMLTVLFFVALTPLGLLLRLFGKDLLRLNRNTHAASYWEPARKGGGLEKMF
ncbi:MAG: hypothetical protein H7A46_16210 [Verrucomicrobiales bacterium]|nr:hypothetical protein [Verrucomicrobiales bacterium]